MYPLLESVKIKHGFAFHLSLHQERMNRACLDLFGTECQLDLGDVIPKLGHAEIGIYKCRLRYDLFNFSSEIEPYIPQKINSLKLIENNDIAYAYKFSDRSVFDDLLKLKGDADEIMIVKNGLITDASYANLIFWDGSDWFTPSQPLLKGVQRQSLLKKGVIKETEIRPSDLKNYTKVALINAMLDFEDKIEIPIENVFIGH